MDSGNESDAKPMSTEMLEYIHDGSKYHPRVNRKEARYKICDRIKRSQAEWKGILLSTQNMGKFLQKVFKAVVSDISQIYQFRVNLAQKLPILFQNL